LYLYQKMAKIFLTILAVFTTEALLAQSLSLPENLKVPPGNYLVYHVYAKGFQIYKCTRLKSDSSKFEWTYVAPQATLFADSVFEKPVGKHYGGPVWENSDGSKVDAEKIQQFVSADSRAIPWLLLKSTSHSGSGVFAGITFIQRINTIGGKALSVKADRTHFGHEIKEAYTAEYLFFRPK